MCCDPLWSSLQCSLVQQIEQNQDKVWLLRIHAFVSIPATFTLVLSLPISFQNNMIELQVSSLTLHFIWSLFHVTPSLGFCHYHPVLTLLDMWIIILSFLLLSWPSLKIQAWTHLLAQLRSATAGWIPCPNEPLELWLEGPSGQIYLFLLLPRKNCV